MTRSDAGRYFWTSRPQCSVGAKNVRKSVAGQHIQVIGEKSSTMMMTKNVIWTKLITSWMD